MPLTIRYNFKLHGFIVIVNRIRASEPLDLSNVGGVDVFRMLVVLHPKEDVIVDLGVDWWETTGRANVAPRCGGFSSKEKASPGPYDVQIYESSPSLQVSIGRPIDGVRSRSSTLLCH